MNTPALALTIVLMVLTSGCGGGGNGGSQPSPPPESAPTVQTLEPANLATGVSIDTGIRVAFDRAIDKSSVHALTMRLDDPSGAAVSGSFSVSASTVTFTPTVPLNDGTVYRASLGSGIKGVNGIGITSFFWTFTTIDLTPPHLTATWPADGGKLLPKGIITVSFDEPIDSASITSDSVAITGPAGPVPGSVSASGNQVSLEAQNAFQEGATYAVAITSDVRDVAGNRYGSSTFQFTAATPVSPVNLYITDQGNKISAWSLAAGSPLTSIGEYATGSGPGAQLASNSKRFVYVLNEKSDSVSAFAAAVDGSLTEIDGSPFSTGGYPFRLAITPDDAYLFVLNFDSESLSVFSVDAETGALGEVAGSPFGVGRSAHSVLVDPSGDYIYVSDADVGLRPYRVNRVNGTLVAGRNRGMYAGGAPLDLALHPSGRFVFGANNDALHVFYIDPVSHEVSHVGEPYLVGSLGDPVRFLAVEPTGRAIYTYNEYDFGICFRIDPNDGRLTQAPSGFARHKTLNDIAFLPDGTTAYATTPILGYGTWPYGDPYGGIVRYLVDAENCTLQESTSVAANYAVRDIVWR